MGAKRDFQKAIDLAKKDEALYREANRKYPCDFNRNRAAAAKEKIETYERWWSARKGD